MKFNFKITILLLLVWAFMNACKNKDIETDSFKIVRDDPNPSANSVTFRGSYSFSGTVKEMKVNIGERDDLTDAFSHKLQIEGTDFFSDTIKGLKPSTPYYYNYTIDFGSGNTYIFPTEGTKSFRTLEADVELPIVRTVRIVPIGDTAIRVDCEVVHKEGQSVAERGICWNTYGEPNIDDNLVPYHTPGEGEYSCKLENLAPNTRYFVRAYAKNDAGPSYGDTLSYKTSSSGLDVYSIFGIADPPEGGIVTGGGPYEEGQSCTLTANANECYEFVNWTKDGEEVSQNPVYPFTVTDTATYVAHFQLKRYTITVAANPANGGSAIVVGGGDTFDCDKTCTVRATEAQGYTFVNWTENGEQVYHEREYTFTVKRNRNLVANFVELQPNQYLIQAVIDPSEGGTVTGSGPYGEGQSCTLTATANDCYEFVNWTDENGEEVSQNEEYTFDVTENATYVAHFRLKQYTVRVSSNTTNGTTYIGEITTTTEATFDCGGNCMVHARANAGYVFEKWTENGMDVDTRADYTFNVTEARNLTAIFTQETYTITVNASTGGSATVNNGGQFHYGEPATLTAMPDDCYQFTSWSDGSTDNPHTVRVTGDATYTASFSPLHYTINVTHGTGGTAHVGSSTGPASQQIDCGTNCTIYAVANEHYEFDKWTEGSTVVSSNAIYPVNNVTESHTFKANFTPKQYTVTVSHTPNAGGMATLSGGGTSGFYTYNQPCTVIGTPATGYHFLGWYKNGTQVWTELSYTFNVTGDCALQARFEINSYTVTVNASPSNGGTVTGSGSYNYGASCTVSATANNGYTFANWTEGGSVVQDAEASYTFTVTGNRTLVANFTQQTTNFDIPQNLTITSYGGAYIFENDVNVTLTWQAVQVSTCRQYKIYRNGNFYASTPYNSVVTNYTIPNSEFHYNMNNSHGEIFTVTAVYDEGESQMSNSVEIWVSGMGNVSGTVYDIDGATPLAGATVTIQGVNEFNVPETYTFVTDENGYYEGAVHAGMHPIAVAQMNGYQSVSTIHSLPLHIVYNQLTNHVDFIFETNSSTTELTENFEDWENTSFTWVNDATYPWVLTTNAHGGAFALKSNNAGVASSSSTISVTVEIPYNGQMSFWAKCEGEGSSTLYDKCIFSIDGAMMMCNGSDVTGWQQITYPITAGFHTFEWKYEKDSAVNPIGDCFTIDDIIFVGQRKPISH